MSYTVDVFQVTVNEFRTGHDVVGTDAQVLTKDGDGNPIGYPAKKYIKVKADLSNGDNVFVGHEGFADGYLLDAGEEVEIPVSSTDKVWVKADASEQGYSWMAV